MISIVIPTYNEGRRLGKSLNYLLEFLKSYSEEVEIIIADDGSTDPTIEVAKSFADKLPNFKILGLPHLGKGAAVRSGFLQSSGDIVLFTDADFSTPISEIDKVVGKIKEGFDVAIGSRALDPSLVKTHQNFLREGMGQTFNLVVQILALPGIHDTQCGFKAFDRATTKILFEKQQINGFAFDVELLYLAKKHSLKMVEVPVLWFNDSQSRVNPLKDSAITFYELLKIRAIHSQEKATFSEKIFYQLNKKRTFVKFVVVGFTVTVVDFSVFLVLTQIFKLPPLVANPISVEVAIIYGFTINNLWTFSARDHQKGLFGRFLVYQFVSFGALLFSQILILVFIHVLGFHSAVAKLATIPFLATFNFLLHNRWTFRDVKDEGSPTIVFSFLILGLLLLYLLLSKLIL